MSRRALCRTLLPVAGLLATSAYLPAGAATSTVKIPAAEKQTSVETLDAVVPVDAEAADTTIPTVAVETKNPAAGANGSSVVCPVASATFTNDYGAPRAGHAYAGIDMLAARGTPILAPVAGTVSHKWSSLGGLSFYLDTPSGEQFFGTHMQSAGTSGHVVAGTVIGYVGDTGNAKGTPHLHFEYHPTKKTHTNPYTMLVRACRPG